MDEERSTVPLTPAGEALRRGLFPRRTDDEFGTEPLTAPSPTGIRSCESSRSTSIARRTAQPAGLPQPAPRRRPLRCSRCRHAPAPGPGRRQYRPRDSTVPTSCPRPSAPGPSGRACGPSSPVRSSTSSSPRSKPDGRLPNLGRRGTRPGSPLSGGHIGSGIERRVLQRSSASRESRASAINRVGDDRGTGPRRSRIRSATARRHRRAPVRSVRRSLPPCRRCGHAAPRACG